VYELSRSSGLSCVSYSGLRPGTYEIEFNYWLVDPDSGLLTGLGPPIVDHLTVLGALELNKYPRDRGVPVGDTTLIEVKGVFPPGEFAVSLRVDCPGGGTDQAVDLALIEDGFATSYPGPFFQGSCGPTLAGIYSATLETNLQRSAQVWFPFYGDRDGDGWWDRSDNCPSDPNPDQLDRDGDQRGDACDDDRDNDGHGDDEDNCPDVKNAAQDDLDVDGKGDACDPDTDDDGVPTEGDNCDFHWNPGQENADGDAFGDACDPDPEDSDNDGLNDLVDNCWNLFNPGQQDLDLDGIGSACDSDIDGDGISNDDEWAAGTNPLDYQPLDPGINDFFDGAPIGEGGSAVDGQPVGVVVNPVGASASVHAVVVDPSGSPYEQHDLIPQSPVVFWFVPIWPGEWRIEADANNGETYAATIHVIPEPRASLAGVASLAVIWARRRWRCRADALARSRRSVV
jgi:hypothetical protein